MSIDKNRATIGTLYLTNYRIIFLSKESATKIHLGTISNIQFQTQFQSKKTKEIEIEFKDVRPNIKIAGDDLNGKFDRFKSYLLHYALPLDYAPPNIDKVCFHLIYIFYKCERSNYILFIVFKLNCQH